jgi:hypothetical protein
VTDRVLVSPHPSRHVAGACLAAIVLLSGGLLTTLGSAPATADHEARHEPTRREQAAFMWAMAGQESGWDYYARNRSSGAFGKYQIMPANWPAWAGQYLGDRRADQTPWNQEQVAAGKLRDLYGWLGSWKRVAYWWLTGSDERREKRWSAYARGYVENIMHLRRRAPADAGELPARTSSRAERGDWRQSATGQRLRAEPGGRPWRRGGHVEDGQVLRVHGAVTKGDRIRWIAVVTRDGRLGWLPQLRTVPTRRPDGARRWQDIQVRRAPDNGDRTPVRPRPR